MFMGGGGGSIIESLSQPLQYPFKKQFLNDIPDLLPRFPRKMAFENTGFFLEKEKCQKATSDNFSKGPFSIRGAHIYFYKVFCRHNINIMLLQQVSPRERFLIHPVCHFKCKRFTNCSLSPSPNASWVEGSCVMDVNVVMAIGSKFERLQSP